METASGTPNPIIARALAVKRVNAVTTILFGGLLSAAVIWLYGAGSIGWAPLAFALGLGCGVLYANAFEYVLHRFFLHWGQGFLVQRHALHHNSIGTREEPRYINFATSPWVVVLVFTLNAAPVFAALFVLERWLERLLSASFGIGIFGAGILCGFTVYFVLYEEIHWRIHMGGWLPQWLRFARRHHMLHHHEIAGYYNIFLPVFDWLFARVEGKRGLAHPH